MSETCFPDFLHLSEYTAFTQLLSSSSCSLPSFPPHIEEYIFRNPPSVFYFMPLHTFIILTFLLSPPSLSSTIHIHPIDCLSPSPSIPLSLYPCLPCQGVYICPAHGRVPNKVERIRGEKTAPLPARVSLSFSISLSFSLFLTVDIFQLMYS